MPFSAPTDVGSVPGGHDSGAKPLAEVVCTELAATLHLGDSMSIDPSESLVDLGLD